MKIFIETGKDVTRFFHLYYIVSPIFTYFTFSVTNGSPEEGLLEIAKHKPMIVTESENRMKLKNRDGVKRRRSRPVKDLQRGLRSIPKSALEKLSSDEPTLLVVRMMRMMMKQPRERSVSWCHWTMVSSTTQKPQVTLRSVKRRSRSLLIPFLRRKKASGAGKSNGMNWIM